MKLKDLRKKIKNKITPKASKAKVAKPGKSKLAGEIPKVSPFGVPWLDSWVASWVVADKIATAKAHDKQFAKVLQGLVDAKFNQRIDEIRRFIKDYPKFAEPPDGGPPEPGTPPAGPQLFEPPDGGPPEPGTPPAGPQLFEPPDGGPPEPGAPTPPPPPNPGPASGFLRDNPWILYWFVSVRAPLIIDMIDAHLTRRMNDIRGR
jgi:hypothetical protein